MTEADKMFEMADTMFEILGYKKTENEKEIIFALNREKIIFSKAPKEIIFKNCKSINMIFFELIKMKLEELGWV